jgi:hypothetical protein
VRGSRRAFLSWRPKGLMVGVFLKGFVIPRRWAFSREREAIWGSFIREIMSDTEERRPRSIGERSEVERFDFSAPNSRFKDGSVRSEITDRGWWNAGIGVGWTHSRLGGDGVSVSGVSDSGSEGSLGVESVSVGDIFGHGPELRDGSESDLGICIVDESDKSGDKGFSVELVGGAGGIEVCRFEERGKGTSPGGV